MPCLCFKVVRNPILDKPTPAWTKAAAHFILTANTATTANYVSALSFNILSSVSVSVLGDMAEHMYILKTMKGTTA